MKIINANGEGPELIHQLSMKYLLIWLAIVDTEDWQQTTLGKQLLNLDSVDIPSCIIVANIQCNDWVKEEVNDYAGGILLVPYCGGLGINTISEELEFDNNSALAIDFARQAKLGWEEVTDEGIG
ncbi:MAG: hypothetical protein CME32_19240 [Gimesia sp.]|uniref:Uncharacterized protein n=1 Tax=Gimesia chilikensis TaxID=2605989 RepID=A0A517PSQ2_9PLAN|nr:hypothetical protein [Gimesia chilikensis]MBN71404.1 hypothetical protein [Gimesia sp.]QDT22397.1 hypothetical protein HG66A1_42050 [Gimesia chilikensis]